LKVKLLVDSACDLPKDLLNKFDIDVLPLKILLDDKEYLDGIDITTEKLYKEMRSGKYPKTAQVSPKIFKKYFTKYAKAGKECIYIAFSSELSGTYQTAVIMAEDIKEKYDNFKINIIDSKCGSTATGLVAYKAGQMIANNFSIDRILKTIRFYSTHMEHIFTLDSLKYLYHGGRINKTSAFVGDLLKIKPILQIEKVQEGKGKIKLIKKVRGQKQALKKIIEIMKERSVYVKDQIIGISHADDLAKALKLKKMIEKEFGYSNFIINFIGSVLGAHLGIGGVGVFFLNEEPEKSLQFNR